LFLLCAVGFLLWIMKEEAAQGFPAGCWTWNFHAVHALYM
jgi:hypothetical protein